MTTQRINDLSALPDEEITALRADAIESIACAYLAGVVTLGLLAQLLAGWWWVDSITSLAIVVLLVKEGREALQGEKCEAAG